MPTSPLVARVLAAAIALQLSLAGLVAIAGGPGVEAAAMERAEILPTAGYAEREVLVATGSAEPIELAAGAASTVPQVPATAPPPTAPPTTAVPTTTVPPPAPEPAQPAPTALPSLAPARAPAPAPAPSSQTTSGGSWRDGACETSMLQWMNDARAAGGRARVADDPVIDHVAFRWSDHLALAGQLAHNPGYSAEVFAARPEAMTVGEVVGRGFEPRSVFDEFMRSPAHRDVILGAAFTRATVGCVRDAGGQSWVVANFWG
jgi:uncharacterized protein YkwD